MESGQAAKKEGRSKLSPEQWQHVRDNHLNILVDKDKDLIEVGWLTNCGHPTCPTRHVVVAFYNCPSRPCPPGRI